MSRRRVTIAEHKTHQSQQQPKSKKVALENTEHIRERNSKSRLYEDYSYNSYVVCRAVYATYAGLSETRFSKTTDWAQLAQGKQKIKTAL